MTTDDILAELKAMHAEMVPTPWQAKPRDFRNEQHPHHWYVSGDIHESQDSGEDEPGLCGIGIAILPGNPTCGDIVKNQANGIAALRNALPSIIAAIEAAAADRAEVERLNAVVTQTEFFKSVAVDAGVEAEAELAALRARVEALEAAAREVVKAGRSSSAKHLLKLAALLAAPTGGE